MRSRIGFIGSLGACALVVTLVSTGWSSRPDPTAGVSNAGSRTATQLSSRTATQAGADRHAGGARPAATAGPGGSRSSEGRAPRVGPAARQGTWHERGPSYPRTTVETNVPIVMTDGTVLRANVTRPADAAGRPISKRLPVIVTIMGYNKDVFTKVMDVGVDPVFLARRGYVHVYADIRGTGSSGGTWQKLGRQESVDSKEIIEWAASRNRPWSDGSVGMAGASYLGITQLFAAAEQPKGLKAIMPVVALGDAYRDVVASGGQFDLAFMPVWMSVVSGPSLVPPVSDPAHLADSLGPIVQHLTTTVPDSYEYLLRGILGDEQTSYDGPFYRERSPLSFIDKVRVPTLLIGGQRDLFQRGSPLLFERLQKDGVPTKFIWGDWDHIEAATTTEGIADYGTQQALQLRWFDHYVRGIPDPTLDSDIAPFTYQDQTTHAWHKARSWIGSNLRARSFALSGSAAPGRPGGLTTGSPTPGTTTLVPLPGQGLCTRSTNQWTGGGQLASIGGPTLPCVGASDQRLNDALGVRFQTAPMSASSRVQGPMNAHLVLSSPTGQGQVSVIVSTVAPDGTVTRHSGGWQVVSFRGMNKARSRYLDGRLIQPWYPYTKASDTGLPKNTPTAVDVEIFPAAFTIPAGDRLEVTVQTFDMPHLMPTLPHLAGSLTPLELRSGSADASELTIPIVAQ